jgi:hypothetical protein
MTDEGWFEYDAHQRGKNPFAEMARFSSVLVVGSISELDPPIFLSGPPDRLRQSMSVISPAVVRVEHTYRGPRTTSLRVAITGACFTATNCLDDVYHYRWTDLVGYHLLLDLNGPSTIPNYDGYFPWKMFLVFPDRDQAVDITYSTQATYKLSDVLTQVEIGLTQTQ